MNISTFARRAGISPSGVRWYEAAGVLPAPVRRENGYREYSDADLSRLTLILALRRIGLTPAEAGRMVDGFIEGESPDATLTAKVEEQRREIARPREVHQLAVRVLAEVGIAWEAARATPVSELLDRRFDYVITLSNSAREEC